MEDHELRSNLERLKLRNVYFIIINNNKSLRGFRKKSILKSEWIMEEKS